MEIPNENIKRLYNQRIKLNRPVNDYLKRFPSLADKPKPKPEAPRPRAEGEDLEIDAKHKGVKKHGDRRKKR